MQNDPGPSGSTADMMITHAHSLLINFIIPMANSERIDPIGHFLDRDLSLPCLQSMKGSITCTNLAGI